MAFVKMEDKTSEGEVIIFPNLYSEISEKLKIDTVLKIEGKISARDREGNLKSDAQIIAEAVSIITDEELENYESTGRRADGLKARKVPQTKTVSQKVSNTQKKSFTPKNNSVVSNKSLEKSTSNPSRSAENYQAEKIQRVFVHIKNPSDHESLLSVKKICGKFPGMSEIILVLGEVEKSAIRMPFKVDSNSDLPKELVRLLGEDCVVLKD